MTSTKNYSGKINSIQYLDSQGRTITSYWDGTQTTTERDLGGNIVYAKGPSGTVRYQYNAAGRLTTETDEGAVKTVTYTYDSAGRRTRMQSDSRDVRYTYGSNSEILKVEDVSQSLSVEYSYNTIGLETNRKYGNGINLVTGYDSAGRIIYRKE